MMKCLFSILSVITVVFLTNACKQQVTNSSYDIISVNPKEAQLFVDDFLIESSTTMKRTLHQPKKDNDGNIPVLALSNEFGEFKGTLEANGTIVYDPRLKKYVMIALAYSPQWAKAHDAKWDGIRFYRFTSEDGIQWVKGEDGRPQRTFPLTREDLKDTVSGEYAANVDVFSFFYDNKDTIYPYKGWQHFSKWGEDGAGQYYMYSKDGVHWKRGPLVVNAYEHVGNASNYAIEQDGRIFEGAGDVTTFYHDPVEDRFLAIVKFSVDKNKNNGVALRSRGYGFFDHPLDEEFDLGTIKELALVPTQDGSNGDMPTDEYYGSSGWRYGSQWLGGLKVWHPEGDYPYSQAGTAFLKLISSRDGIHWQKVNYNNEDGYPEVFIANGIEGGNNGQNDGGYLTEFSNGPLVINDELIFYYGCSSWGKNHEDSLRLTGGGIFRARLRMDGFVSVDAGVLTTKLFKVDANDLYINSKGKIRVEVLDKDNNSMGSALVSGDSIRHLVHFEGKSLGSLSKGNPVKLRFEILDQGKLYSFLLDDQ